eukprot:scaffold114019_cov31-Tisochrysis_lutea.AAC.2
MALEVESAETAVGGRVAMTADEVALTMSQRQKDAGRVQRGERDVARPLDASGPLGRKEKAPPLNGFSGTSKECWHD